ncbi:binding-protein-dependent transporters inner membrane component [Methylorubrum populi]|uniref:Binding-protein-dependent transporters inner membrane component n=1 Tax=Methylorubrum populi TaxID=223967 RepID=A0A169QMB3_9HYPH|nr:ABC transporter permease subunit [Methylorubrum populi]BAU89128.1 binding-protein-dependent transporters inner membrane component [Methylorubrum populi]
MIPRLLAGLSAAALIPAFLLLLPLLHAAPNRLVTGAPVAAADALGAWLWPTVTLAALGPGLLAAGRGRAVASLAGLACLGALALLLAGLGAGAADLIDGKPPATRVRLASGAWAGTVVLIGTLALATRRARLTGGGITAAAVLAGGLACLWAAGSLDALSIAVELRTRSDTLGEAIGDHLVLALGALALAACLTGGLALWRRGRGMVDLAVSGVQVVPAVALFGGLVAVFSALLAAAPTLRGYGLSALGSLPALTGIAAYLLLPLWRGQQAARRAASPAQIDAAHALGLTHRQILATIRLPLGAPLLLGGVRVAAVQALGLATLGALVGAGGLGTLVFDGMAQFAPDLILLGALPIIGLSLATEAALGRLEAALRRRWPR